MAIQLPVKATCMAALCERESGKTPQTKQSLIRCTVYFTEGDVNPVIRPKHKKITL